MSERERETTAFRVGSFRQWKTQKKIIYGIQSTKPS